MAGPLEGVRVVELAAIGPAPHASMVLADLGAEVIRVCRPGTGEAEKAGEAHTLRGRQRVYADLKNPDDRAKVLRLVENADVLIEGFRPGVAERLGVSPADCHSVNPKLVYGRITGWGQSGPYAAMAGHDINYIAITGALAAIGPAEAPSPPLNLVGDFGGGSLFLLVGIIASLYESRNTGIGRVIDAAMVDGVSILLQSIWELRATGGWQDMREANLLDGGAPFYGTYECADGEFIAVGAIEPQFYALFIVGIGLIADELPPQLERTSWPAVRELIADRVRTRTRAEWMATFEGTDACVTPVLHFSEVPAHPHMAARSTLISTGDGDWSSRSAPRFSH
jgi:alpha-methylacyl-CoA racemase